MDADQEHIDKALALLNRKGYEARRIHRVPEHAKARLRTSHLYGPVLYEQEMFLYGDQDLKEFQEDLTARGGVTLTGADRQYTLKTMFMQTLTLQGEVWEAGSYKGGTALLFRRLEEKYAASHAKVRLFDTFEGMPETDAEKDFHGCGDFKDTSIEAVRELVGERDWIAYHKGFVPDTFKGLEPCQIRLAHIDLDIYKAVLEATAFIYPRMARGGVIVYDDYGFFSCPGARDAVDEFFADKKEEPFVLTTGQAIVTKL